MLTIIKKILNLPLLRKGGLAAFDQAMLSATNFLVTILLIKYLPKEDYGFYAIAFSISLYLISIQNALINTPLTILLAEKNSDNKKNYIPALFWGQIFVLIPVIGFAVGILTIVNVYYPNPKIISIYYSLAIASLGILIKEYMKAYLFAVEKELAVIILDFIFVCTYIGFLIIMILIDSITVNRVILALGAASFISAIYQYSIVKVLPSLKHIFSSYGENWQFGRWALIGVTSTHLQNYGYMYVLGLLLGSEAVAEINASRILLMPFGLLAAGWGKISRPYGAKLREANKMDKFYKEVILICAVFCIGILIYTLIINSFSKPISLLFFTDKYDNVFSYVFYWAIIFMVTFFRSNASFGLQVIKKFSKLAIVNVFTMIFSIVLAYFLVLNMQIKGALLASLAGEFLFMIILWYIFTKGVFGDGSLKMQQKKIINSAQGEPG